ncbi:helix-turn-helix domain-containing protein [uncultured Schumannella sp.]|uniref:helix-turn-helix domain-containing protein n=1 Tax=uncultured Schumannella sp. TaxID=1195956 RepID=UPI0025FAA09A|nr:helix-turn-helix domain-containing protein [uncultured Schumannella sp.]
MTSTLERTTATAIAPAVTSDYAEANATRAISISASWLRTDVDLLRDDVHALHGRTRTLDLHDRAHAKATSAGVPELLAELTSSRGMSWSDVAAAAGVSVSAIRKWRNGGAASAENRNSLGRIAALLDVLETSAVADPAQWMEMKLPLPSGYTIRPIDLYVTGHAEALIDIAEQRQDAESVLDQAMPGWRDHRSNYEVVVDAAGERIIRPRGK